MGALYSSMAQVVGAPQPIFMSACLLASAAAAAGLLAVRGAEVVEVRDEEGGLMNDFTGRVRLEDRKPPKGTHVSRHAHTVLVLVADFDSQHHEVWSVLLLRWASCIGNVWQEALTLLSLRYPQ